MLKISLEIFKQQTRSVFLRKLLISDIYIVSHFNPWITKPNPKFIFREIRAPSGSQTLVNESRIFFPIESTRKVSRVDR